MSIRTPGFYYKIFDMTEKVNTTNVKTRKPLFLAAVSADKGPEELRYTDIDDFFKSYITDTNIFSKHGQPLLQVANIINSGGHVLIKRIVADDAALANISVFAHTSRESVQKADINGNLLYADSVTGNETIDPTDNSPIMENICKIRYEVCAFSNDKTIEECYESAEALGGTGEDTYHLFTISDVGRGESLKKFKITPLYDESRFADHMKYTLHVMEGEQTLETASMAFDPDVIENGVSRTVESILNTYSTQLRGMVNEARMVDFINKVSELSGNDFEYCLGNDILFGYEKRAQRDMRKMNNIEVDLINGANLSDPFGQSLLMGDNGSFGSAPIGTKAYEDKLIQFFAGDIDTEVFDRDSYKIDAVVDANYPKAVKREIESLCEYREDFYFFRDFGTNVYTLEDFLYEHASVTNSKYSASYITHYKISDPYTKKPIRVTITYDLAAMLVSHIRDNVHKPLAGIANGFVFRNYIKDTVNFIPAITPKVNQKDILAEAGLNYVCYYDDSLVLETEYSSQEMLSDLSYINNVLLIQSVIKELRTKCPKNRYLFLDGEDLGRYLADVDEVLTPYRSKFRRLQFTYMQDPAAIDAKVFYGVIEVVVRDFAQSEYFEVYVMND